MHTPKLYAVCHNPACSWYEQIREASFIKVGQDMFARPAVYCGCSTDREMLQVEPPDLSAELYVDQAADVDLHVENGELVATLYPITRFGLEGSEPCS